MSAIENFSVFSGGHLYYPQFYDYSAGLSATENSSIIYRFMRTIQFGSYRELKYYLPFYEYNTDLSATENSSIIYRFLSTIQVCQLQGTLVLSTILWVQYRFDSYRGIQNNLPFYEYYTGLSATEEFSIIYHHTGLSVIEDFSIILKILLKSISLFYRVTVLNSFVYNTTCFTIHRFMTLNWGIINVYRQNDCIKCCRIECLLIIHYLVYWKSQIMIWILIKFGHP